MKFIVQVSERSSKVEITGSPTNFILKEKI